MRETLRRFQEASLYTHNADLLTATSVTYSYVIAAGYQLGHSSLARNAARQRISTPSVDNLPVTLWTTLAEALGLCLPNEMPYPDAGE